MKRIHYFVLICLLFSSCGNGAYLKPYKYWSEEIDGDTYNIISSHIYDTIDNDLLVYSIPIDSTFSITRKYNSGKVMVEIKKIDDSESIIYYSGFFKKEGRFNKELRIVLKDILKM